MTGAVSKSPESRDGEPEELESSSQGLTKETDPVGKEEGSGDPSLPESACVCLLHPTKIPAQYTKIVTAVVK